MGGSDATQVPWVSILVLAAATYIAWAANSYCRSPLRNYPGPFLAGWTDAWRFYHTLRGNIHLVNRQTHEKYGPIVRTGPNNLDLDLPVLIKTIYSSDGKWRKTDFYPPASNVADGKVVPNLFSLLDPAEHARQKRPVAKHYSLAGVLQLECHFDDAIRLLCHQLEERYMTRDGEFGTGFDIGQWIKMYAWDVIGQITFSKRFGYLDKGRDFDGHLWLSEMGSDYLASVSQLPYLDRWIDKNPIFPIGGATVLLGPTLRYVADRHHGRDGDTHDDTKPDFLDKFIQAKTEHPDVVDDTQIISYLAINMLAGADTTAISIKAVLYYVLRSPHAQQRLEDEILTAEFVRHQTIPPAYEDIKGLPYLEAVVKEAMRLHPGVAMTLPRFVPPGEGLVLPDGSVVPPGTSVGMNPYVIGRNKPVWGQDADEFRPDRWLRGGEEAEEAYAERLKVMNNSDLTFGAGSRVCLGRHFGLVEVYKVVASLFALYEMETVHPVKEWWVRNGFFLRQKGPDVRMRPRLRI
ncbi:pisatin demethylase [Plectosphaerella plurivora]|uniref:Pisatin demethylase n=1 Tax=Plectosphaerella plurivora TaxID=936078 RepID=A0A9P9AEK5_9PEZI|nr:pisatin demethylase [Plectosphaerella plurivora]